MNAVKTYFLDVITKNYVNFEGRADRKEFWMFFLFNFVIGIVLSFLGGMDNILGTLFTIIYVLYYLGILLPMLSIGARRLHDTDRSGWWWLINFLPIIGWIVLLVF